MEMFLIVGSTMIIFMLRSSIAAALGFAIVFKTQIGRDRRIYKLPFAKNQLSSELKTVAKVVPYYSLLVGLAYYFNLLHLSQFSVAGTLLTFFLIFIWNEIWFYGLHRILHHPQFMFIHATHHKSRVVSPLSIASFSILEQTLHVMFALVLPIVASQFLPITFAGVVIYSLFQIAVNLLGHMNVEVYPPWFASSMVGKWFTTPTFHGLHHGRSHGHYGLLTTIPDRIFSTCFKDYELVQRRAAQGNGLVSLGERIEVRG